MEEDKRNAHFRKSLLRQRGGHQLAAHSRLVDAVTSFRKHGLEYQGLSSTDEEAVVRVEETPRKRKRKRGLFNAINDEEINTDTEEDINKDKEDSHISKQYLASLQS